MKRSKIIDLSVTTVNNPPGAYIQSEIIYSTHKDSAELWGKILNWPDDLLPESGFAAVELAKISTHAGTHLDAPWHYGPNSGGKPAKTIDQIPLEWCYGDGVLLDFSHKKRGESISVEDVKQTLDKINYKIKPFDIVLIRTDTSKHYGESGYENMHPGMTRQATLWLIEQGVRVMGIDAWGWDRPFDIMLEEHKSGVKGNFWAAHFAGKEKEYCHIENLANLDLIPVPYGFKVAVFPVKIKRASAGWTRAVAIMDG